MRIRFAASLKNDQFVGLWFLRLTAVLMLYLSSFSGWLRRSRRSSKWGEPRIRFHLWKDNRLRLRPRLPAVWFKATNVPTGRIMVWVCCLLRWWVKFVSSYSGRCLFVCLQFVAATTSFVIQSVVKIRQMKLNAWRVNSTSDIVFLNLLSWIYLALGYCFTGMT